MNGVRILANHLCQLQRVQGDAKAGVVPSAGLPWSFARGGKLHSQMPQLPQAMPTWAMPAFLDIPVTGRHFCSTKIVLSVLGACSLPSDSLDSEKDRS